MGKAWGGDEAAQPATARASSSRGRAQCAPGCNSRRELLLFARVGTVMSGGKRCGRGEPAFSLVYLFYIGVHSLGGNVRYGSFSRARESLKA